MAFRTGYWLIKTRAWVVYPHLAGAATSNAINTQARLLQQFFDSGFAGIAHHPSCSWLVRLVMASSGRAKVGQAIGAVFRPVLLGAEPPKSSLMQLAGQHA